MKIKVYKTTEYDAVVELDGVVIHEGSGEHTIKTMGLLAESFAIHLGCGFEWVEWEEDE